MTCLATGKTTSRQKEPSHAVYRSFAVGVGRQSQPLELLAGRMRLHRMRETEWDGETALGQPKHWHLFEVFGAGPAHGIVRIADRPMADGRRQRRLTNDEYRQLGRALKAAEVWKPAIAAIWLMILTGWRRGEVLGLRWSEVDLPRRTARLADTKTGASLRPLSELACIVIQSQPRIGDVVFASRSGERR